MKKYILFLMVLGIFVFGASKAQAVTIKDLQKQIQSLSEQISSLKSELVGMVISSITPTATTTPSSAISMPSAVTNITKGTTGTEVVAIQNALKSGGYFPETVNATGYYGDITTKAVSDYQKANSLPVTGTVDTGTLTKLNSTELIADSSTIPKGVNISRDNLTKLNWSDQINLYENLPAEQKYSLWQDKINYLILNKDITGDQYLAFKSLKSSMSANWFSNENQAYGQQKVTDWINQNKNTFTKEERGLFCASLQNSGYPISVAPGGPAKSKCNCRSWSECQSDWCGSTDCTHTYMGCGCLWLWSCNAFDGGAPNYVN